MDMGMIAVPQCKICLRLLLEYEFSSDLYDHLNKHPKELHKYAQIENVENHFKAIEILF